MYKRKARQAVGKIANHNVTPLEDSLVMVKSYTIAEHTAAEQMKAGTLWSIYNDQKSPSKIHGPLKGICILPDGKKGVIIDNVLPPRMPGKWTWNHEFYE